MKISSIDRALHELKQPANLIRVIAQDVRLDVRKGRLDMDSLSESMQTIEEAVDELVLLIDGLRASPGVTEEPPAME